MEFQSGVSDEGYVTVHSLKLPHADNPHTHSVYIAQSSKNACFKAHLEECASHAAYHQYMHNTENRHGCDHFLVEKLHQVVLPVLIFMHRANVTPFC
jgi:hypothetical protein